MRYFIIVNSILASLSCQAQDFQWALPLGSTSYDGSTDVVSDASGNVYLTGIFQGTIDMDPGPGIYNLINQGSNDVFAAKYSPDGQLVWAVSFGGPQFDQGGAIQIDDDGNVYVAGGFRSTVDFDPGPGVFNLVSAGNLDFFLVKLNPSGEFIWAFRIGGTGEETADALEYDNDAIYFSGLFTNTVDFDPGPATVNLVPTGSQDAYIAKFTADGNFVWAKNFGTSGGEFCYDLALTGGFVYACGSFYGTMDIDPGPGTFNIVASGFNSRNYLLKWTTDAVFNWGASFGGGGGNSAHALDYDSEGNIYMTGNFSGSGDFDPGAGTFTMDGGSNSLYPDIFLVKFTGTGTFIWATSMGIPNLTSIAYGLDVSTSDEVYITGLYAGTVDFDPGAGTSLLTAGGSSDGFIARYDSDGNYMWAGSYGGTQSDFGVSISTSGSGTIYTAGSFSWTNVDLDPTEGEFIYSSLSNSNDAVLIKQGTCSPQLVNQLVTLCPGETVFAGGMLQSDPGLYTDILTGVNGCDSIVQTEVLFQFDYNWLEDFTSCNEPIQLNVTATGADVLWSTGETATSIEINQSGTYTIEVTGPGCTFHDTTLVEIFPLPAVDIITGYDGCVGGYYATVSYTASEPVAIEWILPPGLNDVTLWYLEEGEYSVMVTDVNGCSASAAITLFHSAACEADFSGDGIVGVQDLLAFIPMYGCEGDCCPFDLNFDGYVVVNDLLTFIAQFSAECPN